jgi:predicted TIM-barrel fold metal-dependent hydrolase
MLHRKIIGPDILFRRCSFSATNPFLRKSLVLDVMIIDGQHHYRVNGSIPSEMSSRLRWMNENGIDIAIVTTPRDGLTKNANGATEQIMSTWTDWNDELTAVERKYPEQFIAGPAIPFFDAKTAVDELDRVVSKNEARALFIQPYKWRIDHEYLTPLYEKLDDLRIPIFFHPVHNDMEYHGMGSVAGFPFNTTMALSCFLTSGLLDKFTHLKIVIPHMGGTLPFVLGRLETEYEAGKFKAARPPTEYFDNFFFDVVSYSQEPFEFAASVLGYDRLVFGSDYGCPGKGMVQPKLFRSLVERLPIEQSRKQRIFSGNLAGALKIEINSSRVIDENVTTPITSPNI